MKGPVLGAVWYGEPSRRQFSDIDVLVRRQDFARSLQALLDEGFAEHSANWKGFLDHGVAEIPITGGATTIDLHWDLVALGTTAPRDPLDMAPLFDRAETVELAPTVQVATLDPVDTLVHLCINGGLDGRGASGGWWTSTWSPVAAGSTGHRSSLGRVARRGGPLLGRAPALRRAVGTALPDGLLAELEPFPGWLRL